MEHYVINFSVNRNHWVYTYKNYPCIYTGTLYITKNNYALVKAIENWEITKYPDSYKTNFGLRYVPKKHKEIDKKQETRITNYAKQKDGLYYRVSSLLTASGVLLSKENISHHYSETIKSKWYNINTEKVTPIKYKEEVDKEKFKNAAYHKEFWDNFIH